MLSTRLTPNYTFHSAKQIVTFHKLHCLPASQSCSRFRHFHRLLVAVSQSKSQEQSPRLGSVLYWHLRFGGDIGHRRLDSLRYRNEESFDQNNKIRSCCQSRSVEYTVQFSSPRSWSGKIKSKMSHRPNHNRRFGVVVKSPCKSSTDQAMVPVSFLVFVHQISR